jgi:hypothetical protein
VVYYLDILPVSIIRFALFVPFAFYWTPAMDHWNVILDHEELRNGTFGSAIPAGEQVAASWSRFGFFWNFAAWLPCFYFRPPLNLPFAVMDSIITVYIAIATHLQTAYTPHHKSHCGDAHSWQRPSNATESFFEAAARLNATATSPEHMCVTFVEEWQYGVSISWVSPMLSFRRLTFPVSYIPSSLWLSCLLSASHFAISDVNV